MTPEISIALSSEIINYPKSFIKKRNYRICIPVRLPKGWYMNDYSQSENLIEIEDRNEGDRFWLEPVVLFKAKLSVGQKIRIREFGKPSVADFMPLTFRRVEYITAVLLPPL